MGCISRFRCFSFVWLCKYGNAVSARFPFTLARALFQLSRDSKHGLTKFQNAINASSLDANRSKPNFVRERLCLRSQIPATKSLSCACRPNPLPGDHFWTRSLLQTCQSCSRFPYPKDRRMTLSFCPRGFLLSQTSDSLHRYDLTM